jgi:hypothetical protein
MSETWKVDNAKECYKNCDHIKTLDKQDIVLSNDLWNVIQAMTRKFKDVEWQMMLTGEVTKEGCYCDGYYITKQKVSGGTVKNTDLVDDAMIKEKKIVAGIHSHVNMGVTASTTDIEDSVMSMIDYHIIVNNSLNVNGMRKVHLPCSGLGVAECGVLVEGLVDLDTIVIEGTERIERATYGTPEATAWRRYEEANDAELARHLARSYDY